MHKQIIGLILLAFYHNQCFAKHPEYIICGSYATSFFCPDCKKGNRIETDEEEKTEILEDTPEKDYLSQSIVIDFVNNQLKHHNDRKIITESIVKMAEGVYLMKGEEIQSKKAVKYFGTYTFDKKYTKAIHTADGNYIEYYICKEKKR